MPHKGSIKLHMCLDRIIAAFQGRVIGGSIVMSYLSTR